MTVNHQRKIPAGILDQEIVGRNLSGATLRDQIPDTPLLLAFLRHLG